jgi:hypothetical protein
MNVFIELNTVASFRNGRRERPLCFKLDGCLTLIYSLHTYQPVHAFTANNRAYYRLVDDLLIPGRGPGVHPVCTGGVVLEGAKVMNECNCTSDLQYVLLSSCLIKLRDSVFKTRLLSCVRLSKVDISRSKS